MCFEYPDGLITGNREVDLFPGTRYVLVIHDLVQSHPLTRAFAPTAFAKNPIPDHYILGVSTIMGQEWWALLAKISIVVRVGSTIRSGWTSTVCTRSPVPRQRP